MANVILGLLLTVGPQTIYDLNKQFEAGVSLFYRASLGALRTALAALLARGDVEVEEVVEGGRAKMRDPITASDLETAAMSKTFFLALVPALDERLAVLDDIIERASADTAELEGVAVHLDSFQVPAEHADAFRFQRATLAYGIGAHRYAVDFGRALRVRFAPVR